ncbi:hypothetical protein [Dongia sp.]|uniref:hypothetical protein n=1 Tax=Dongia sp. TaxID=1977262 RepID=UPI0035B40EDA
MLGADAILEFCAVVGLIAYGVTFRAAHPAQYLHRCLAALFISLGILLLARGIFSLTQEKLFAHLAMVAALFLPLMTLLCAEAIRREHAPLLAKLIAAVAPFVLALWHVAEWRGASPDSLIPRSLIVVEAFVLGGLLGSALWVRQSPAGRLSVENHRFAQFFVVAILLAIPFAATDFQNFLELPVRMGAIGALIGVHFAVWVPNAGVKFRLVLFQLLAIFVFALVLIGLGIPWFGDRNWIFLIRAWAAISGILLTAGIALKLTADFIRRRSNRFIERFLACDTGSVDGFLGTAAMLAPFTDLRILEAESLADYDHLALVSKLSGGKVVSLRVLKRQSEADISAAIQEQIIDILEHAGATHLCLVSSSPIRLALFTAGPLADEGEIQSQIGLFARTIDLIARRNQYADIA